MHTRFDMIQYSCYSTPTIVSGGPRLGVAPRKASSVAAEPACFRCVPALLERTRPAALTDPLANRDCGHLLALTIGVPDRC